MNYLKLLLVAVLLGAAFQAQLSAQVIFPYLQSPSPTTIVITWKTSADLQSLVEYGLTAGNLNTSLNGTCQIWTDNGYNNNYYYHTVKLSGLSPNTKYYYRVTTGARTSAVHSFRTLPLPGQAATNDGHIRFLVLGDNQIEAEPRYDSLMTAAKRKVQQLYAGTVNDNIAMILNVGDQVDVGTLDHYENVHFAKSRYLSPELPIQTIVGNHETYGTLQMSAYVNHFYLDSMPYQGINSGTENYYAIQAGPVLFVCMSSEHTSTAQFNWVQQVVSAANTDASVQWIVTLAHRPYQAEQFVGDISQWVRNTVMPFLKTSPKFVLHIGAHHHLYARGQLKDASAYHIISGGTAWDQYWGMAAEQDFDDVQKTISNWAYNIIDVDVANQTMDVETYSIGSIYQYKDNQLMDEFHRYKNRPAPQTPSIATVFPDSIQFPYTVNSSAFVSPAGELLNTTEFLISQDAAFASIEEDILRDYENLYGDAGAPDTTADMNLGINILDLYMPANFLPNGWHYIKVRHRDRNLEWSAWSAVDSFKVFNSIANGDPVLTLDRAAYELSDTIYATYGNGPGLATDWVGIYREGDVPGNVGSVTWSYVSGTAGVETFTGLPTAGAYFAAFFTNDGYTEIAPRVPFYAGPIPQLSSDSVHYQLGSPVQITYANCPGLPQDWIGIYKVGRVPGVDGSQTFQYTSGASGTRTFNNLPKGYYFANYFLTNEYTEPVGRIFFSVGDTITQLQINKSIYNLNEYITATWTDAPGIVKDWLGIYDSLANPNTDPLLSYNYFGGLTDGTKVLTDTLLPQAAGRYFLVMFTNDSYTEVSNRCYFEVVDTAGTDIQNIVGNDMNVKLYPNPSASNGQTIIESKYLIDRLEFFNEQGQLVYASENLHTRHFSLVNADLPAGVYYVRVYQDNRSVHTYKLVIAQ